MKELYYLAPPKLVVKIRHCLTEPFNFGSSSKSSMILHRISC